MITTSHTLIFFHSSLSRTNDHIGTLGIFAELNWNDSLFIHTEEIWFKVDKRLPDCQSQAKSAALLDHAEKIFFKFINSAARLEISSLLTKSEKNNTVFKRYQTGVGFIFHSISKAFESNIQPANRSQKDFQQGTQDCANAVGLFKAIFFYEQIRDSRIVAARQVLKIWMCICQLEQHHWSEPVPKQESEDPEPKSSSC